MYIAVQVPEHEPVLINELRLSDFKQVLSKAGIMAEFNAGILWCANGTIALRKVRSCLQMCPLYGYRYPLFLIHGCFIKEYYEELLKSDIFIFNFSPQLSDSISN